MSRILVTHRGWFGLCPVYIGNAKDEEPFLEPVHWVLAWLLWVSAWMYEMAFLSCELMGVEAGDYKISAVKRLDKPFFIEVD
jgi:hypothetical protein